MTENCYILLELSFDPPETNESVIEQRIVEKSKLWASNFNDFMKGADYKQNHQNLGEIRKIMLDPQLRKEEARRACEMTYGQVDKYINMVVNEEIITENQGKNIAEKFKQPLEVVIKRVEALGFIWKDLESYKNYYNQFYKSEPKDAAKYEVMVAYLKPLGAKDYYDVLKESEAEEIENFSCNELLSRAQNVKNIRYGKNDSTSSAGKKICEACEVVFSSNENRASYDGYLYWKRIKGILDEVKDIAQIDNNKIKGDLFVTELEQATRNMVIAKRIFIVFCTIENIDFTLSEAVKEQKYAKPLEANRQPQAAPPPPPPVPNQNYQQTQNQPVQSPKKRMQIYSVKTLGWKSTSMPPWDGRNYCTTINRNEFEHVYFEFEFTEPGVETTVGYGYTLYTSEGRAVINRSDRCKLEATHSLFTAHMGIDTLPNGNYYAEVFIGDSDNFKVPLIITGIEPLKMMHVTMFGAKTNKKTPDVQDRVYTDIIDRKRTKVVFFEIGLNHELGTNKEWAAGYRIYDEYGTNVGSFDDNSSFPANSDTLFYSWWMPDDLATGHYYVEMFLGNVQGIKKQFSVINGKSGNNSTQESSGESSSKGSCLGTIIFVVIIYVIIRIIF